jgi:hypothetical protein
MIYLALCLQKAQEDSMPKKVQIGEKKKGGLGQTEDWWYFVTEDDGTHCVEHEWSYVDPYGKSPGSEGSKKIPVNEFLASGEAPGLKARVREELKKAR